MDTVRVIYHHEPDGWWAESPDIDGWSAAGATYDEVHRLVEEGVRFPLERETVHLECYLPGGERDLSFVRLGAEGAGRASALSLA